MARPVTTLVVFFVAFNLLAVMLSTTGAAAAVGLNTEVGGDAAVDERTNKEKIQSGGSTGVTLFGLYNVLSNQVGNLYNVVYPGLAMLERAGVPGYITDGFLGNLFSVMIVIDVISFLRGWGL